MTSPYTNSANVSVTEKRAGVKFRVYESLYFLNRNLHEIVGLLEQIKKSPGIPRQKFEAYQVEIQYLRSEATQDVLEVMNDVEIDEAAKLGRRKKAYDDSIRDLDDVYFEVERREEERRKKGLPPMIGVLRRDFAETLSTSEYNSKRDNELVDLTLLRRARSQDKIKSQPPTNPKRNQGKYRALGGRPNPQTKNALRWPRSERALVPIDGRPMLRTLRAETFLFQSMIPDRFFEPNFQPRWLRRCLGEPITGRAAWCRDRNPSRFAARSVQSNGIHVLVQSHDVAQRDVYVHQVRVIPKASSLKPAARRAMVASATVMHFE